MKKPSLLVASTLCAGILVSGTSSVAVLATSLPAQAATEPTASSDRITATLEGNRAGFDLTGTNGTAVRVTAGGRTVAGSVIHDGTAHLVFGTTSRKATYTVVETLGGVDSEVGTVSLGDDDAELPSPTVENLSGSGSKAVADVVAEPGAVVRVVDRGKTVGLKKVGASGTTQIPVAVDAAGADIDFSIDQSIGSETSDAETVSWLGPPTVDVVTEYEGGAVVRMATNSGGTMTVRDESGKAVFTTRLSYLSEKHFTVPLEKGMTSTFTIVRDSGGSASSPVSFTVQGSDAAIPAPSVEAFHPDSASEGTWLRVTGLPFTHVRSYAADGTPTYLGNTADENGIVTVKNVTPGETYLFSDGIRDYQSATTSFVVPDLTE